MRMGMMAMVVRSLVVMAVVAAAGTASAQSVSKSPEVALMYDWTHGNAPPGGCGCFGANGAAANFAYPLRKISLVGDFSTVHATSINTTGTITLQTYTAGARYDTPFHYKALQPFGQVMAGGARTTGNLSSGFAFAGIVGGGLNVGLNRRFGLRLVEADYVATTLSNGSNNHQNNLRITTGLIVRF